MARVSVRSGLEYPELLRLVSEPQAAQVSPFDGAATLVTLRTARRRMLTSSGIARALRGRNFATDEPVFVAVSELTAEAVDYLSSLNVEALRDPPQSVVTRSDDDVARR